MSLPLKRIMVSVLLIGLLITGFTGTAGAERYLLDGDRNGLEIHLPPKTQDTGNLNPGDHQSTCLELVNTGRETITVYIRTDILRKISPHGGSLADLMKLTLENDGKGFAAGTFQEIADAGNIPLGEMLPGARKEICFFASLPQDSRNEYQGASFEANWAFTTERTGGSSEGGDDPGSGSDDYDDPQGPRPPLEIDDEPIPQGEPQRPNEQDTPVIEIPDGDIPAGKPGMPKTGEASHLPYYLLGTFAILTGIGLGRRKR
jgi:LPXTG-motif cell wall-anchored protein